MTFEEFKKKYQTGPWPDRISQWLQELFNSGGSKEKASDYSDETRLRILWAYTQKHNKTVEEVLGLGQEKPKEEDSKGLSNPVKKPKSPEGSRSIADIVTDCQNASRPADFIKALTGLTPRMLKTYADHLTPKFLRIVTDYGDYDVAEMAEKILAKMPRGTELTLRPGQAAKVLLQRGVSDEDVDVVGKDTLTLDFPGGHQFRLNFEKKSAELGTVDGSAFHVDRKFKMTDKFIHDLADAYMRRKA